MRSVSPPSESAVSEALKIIEIAKDKNALESAISDLKEASKEYLEARDKYSLEIEKSLKAATEAKAEQGKISGTLEEAEAIKAHAQSALAEAEKIKADAEKYLKSEIESLKSEKEALLSKQAELETKHKILDSTAKALQELKDHYEGLKAKSKTIFQKSSELSKIAEDFNV